MKKKILILCLSICLLFTLSSVCAGDVNETVVASDTNQVIEEVDDAVSELDNEIVSSSQDEIIGSPDDGTFTALQKKINDADADSTVELENDYAYDDGFDINGITIDKPLTIDGKGYTIDAKGKSRVFNITGAVTLKNLNIKNANFDGSGGAIYSDDSVTVENCNFVNNSATELGGVICFGDNGKVTNCNFTDNYAEFYSCIAFLIDGTVENCNFKNNKANWVLQFTYTIMVK